MCPTYQENAGGEQTPADSSRRKGSTMTVPPREIPLKAVDLQDLTFVITYGSHLGPLKDSIARVGLLHPPVLQEIPQSGRQRVVSGYKRLRAAQALGIERITAHLAPPGDDLGLFLMGLHENLGTRPLNVVEKSQALDKLVHQFRLKREEILGDHLPALGLGCDAKTLELYLSLSGLEDDIKQELAAGRLSLSAAHQLSSLSPADRLAFCHLVTALGLGKNLQREFLRLLADLSRMQKTTMSALLEAEEMTSLVQDPQVQASVRAKGVRQLLLRRRYPRLSRAADAFQELKKKLRLPPHLSLTASPFFEGRDYRLTVTFHNREQLAAARKALDGMADSSLLAELLELTIRDGE